jgi:hypothetical protein
VLQTTQPLIYDGYAGAFASFFATRDPNAHKLTNASQAGVPELGTGKEFVISSGGFTNVEIAELEKRCAFWASVAGSVPV